MEHPASLRGKRILVVDDDPETLELLAILLERCGCQVATALDVATALAALTGSVFDLLVCDIAIPAVDGYHLIREVRALPDTASRIPALALTAMGRQSRITALQAGYDSHICKPADPDELVIVLAGLLDAAARARLRTS